LSGIIDAFRFLSAVPLPARRGGDDAGLANAVAFFPLVGGALGGLLVLTDWACGRAFPRVSHFLSAALILAVYALFTGGLHHDGLMDSADAFWGHRPREQRLRIMKDSRAGALGVAAIALFLLVELAAIYALPAQLAGSSGRFRWAALLAFPVLGRWAMAYMCVRFPYARAEGTGAAMVGGSRARHFALATFFAAAILAACFVFLTRVPLLIAVLPAAVLALAEMAGGFFSRSLGGVTGDVIGATGMLTEALALLILASRIPELLLG
jgi:cobalamin 5'-phosphate synthase/cobalamin synthase